MSFGQELQDFVSGFKTGADIGNKHAQNEMYRDSMNERSGKETDEQKAAIDAEAAKTAIPTRRASSSTPSVDGSGGGSGGGSDTRTANLDGLGDPVANDLQPYQKAFLNAIAGGESRGRYNVRYTPRGGATFDENGQHPGIAEMGPAGPSTAAGRYQFTKTTWDELTGGKVPFTHENQDKFAWQLAQRDYRAHTGKDLSQALQQGANPGVFKTLAPTWTSLGGKGADRATQIYNASLDRYASTNGPQPVNAGPANPVRTASAPAPAQQPKSALPVVPASLSMMPSSMGGEAQSINAGPTQESEPVDPETGEPVQTTVAAYADGGPVEDPNEGAPLPPPRPSALPVTDAGNDQAPAQQTALPSPGQEWGPEQAAAARENTPDNRGAGGDPGYDPKKLVDPDGAAQAAHDGLSFIQKFFGFDNSQAAIPQASPDRAEKVQEFNKGAGAPSVGEVRQVDQTIDPNNQLSEDQRSMARLYAGWKYFTDHGQHDRAAKYAGSMLMFGRVHSMMAGQLALSALQKGDVKGAAGIIQEASAENPTGESIQVGEVTPQGVSFKMLDADGQVQHEGVAGTQQLAQMAMTLRNGTAWMSQMGRFAGSRGTRGGGSGGPRPMTEAQQAKQEATQHAEDADAAFDDAGADNDEFMKSMTEGQRTAFMNMNAKQRATRRNQWRAQQKDQLAQAKVESETQRKEKGALDEQEFAAHYRDYQKALEELNAQKAQDEQDAPGTISPAQQELAKKVSAARDGIYKWGADDAGRAKLITGKSLQAVPKASKGASSDAIDPNASPAMQLASQADAAWKRATKGKDVDPGDRDDVLTEVGKQVGTPDKPLDTNQTVLYQTPAIDIVHGNSRLTAAQAVQIVRQAVDGPGGISNAGHGRVSFDGGPPVYITQDGLNQIATLRRMKQPRAENPIKDQGGSGPGDNGAAAPKTALPAQLNRSRGQAQDYLAKKRAENAGYEAQQRAYNDYSAIPTPALRR